MKLLCQRFLLVKILFELKFYSVSSRHNRYILRVQRMEDEFLNFFPRMGEYFAIKGAKIFLREEEMPTYGESVSITHPKTNFVLLLCLQRRNAKIRPEEWHANLHVYWYTPWAGTTVSFLFRHEKLIFYSNHFQILFFIRILISLEFLQEFWFQP